MTIEIISPTDPHNENLPPTHSGIESIFSEETPNFLVASILFEMQIKSVSYTHLRAHET